MLVPEITVPDAIAGFKEITVNVTYSTAGREESYLEKIRLCNRFRRQGI